MDYNLHKNPIVREKPARGREMQTKIIPKELVEALKTSPATKNVNVDSALDSGGQKSEGTADLYYEGYIDGKLYLVPDSNLEAMKDIINLKMRRQNSSNEKPQTSLDEPTQYFEFESKLNGLLEKVNELARLSTGDISVELDVERSSDTAKPELDTAKHKEQEIIPSRDEPEKEIPSSNESKDKDELDLLCPPLLDKNIKYKNVRPTDPSKRKYIRDLIKFKQQSILDESFETSPSKITTETFRLLISGHLQDGFTPIFIIHQNYTGPNILENHQLDFKSHQKEGNIDIFVSGKFFADNILEEESLESPALINIQSRQILIDKQSNIHSQKFKDVYSVGPVEIGLEGEFIRDKRTFKFTPILSLEIVKLNFEGPSFGENSYPPVAIPPIVLMQSKENKYSPFQKSKINKRSSADQKDVKYNNKALTLQLTTKNKSVVKIILDKFRKRNLPRTIFVKQQTVEGTSDGILQIGSSDLKWVAKPKKTKETQHLKGSKRKSSIFRKLSIWKKDKNMNTTDPNSSLPGPSRQASISEHGVPDSKPLTDTEEDNSVPVSKVKKQKTHKTGKKNQAIIENPILAQMQEFFIA